MKKLLVTIRWFSHITFGRIFIYEKKNILNLSLFKKKLKGLLIKKCICLIGDSFMKGTMIR